MQEIQTLEKTANLLDTLYTPKQIADRGIMSLVTQWKERDRKRLKFYQFGRKIYYSEAHLQEYLDLCETKAEAKIDDKNAAKMKEANQPANRFGR